jgi:hypothetical protein
MIGIGSKCQLLFFLAQLVVRHVRVGMTTSSYPSISQLGLLGGLFIRANAAWCELKRSGAKNDKAARQFAAVSDHTTNSNKNRIVL